MSEFLPNSFVAASVALPAKMKADLVAHHQAAGILQTDRVALSYTVKDDIIHCLFADSAEFPSDPATDQYTTALAAALPGNPAHQGDGVYILDTPIGTGGVCTVANKITSLHGPIELVENWAADKNLPIYDLAGLDGSPWIMPVFQRAERHKRVGLALAFSAIAFAVFTATNVASIIQSKKVFARGEQQIKSVSKAYEQELSGQLENITNQPALAAIGRLYELGRIRRETKGSLLEFRIDNDKITWVAEVPDWITQDQILVFGKNIQREIIPGKKSLKLTATEIIK
jgi:hypothetical protein